MSENKKMIAEIARLYYHNNETQADIARRFNISRPKVSRILSEARETGIVKIFIDSSAESMTDIERRIFSRFNLKGIHVVFVPEGDVELAVRLTAGAGAGYLSRYISDGDRIGFSWGWTLYETVKAMPSLSLPNSSVVQLTGGVDNAQTRSYANEIISTFSNKCGIKSAKTLPCPAIVDNEIILDILRHDAKIKNILEDGAACNKLFVNIALPDKGSCLYKSSYLLDKDLEELERYGAVGSVCCRFYDKNGNICNKELDDRTVGISYDNIRKAECVMACISGFNKAEAIYYALKSELIDVLVIDSITAEKLIEVIDNNDRADKTKTVPSPKVL